MRLERCSSRFSSFGLKTRIGMFIVSFSVSLHPLSL
jgi:hypothetical protein